MQMMFFLSIIKQYLQPKVNTKEITIFRYWHLTYITKKDNFKFEQT